jgi:protein SCO1/2
MHRADLIAASTPPTEITGRPNPEFRWALLPKCNMQRPDPLGLPVQKLARQAGVANLELVSITMEPAYDTPGVLKQYAAGHGIDTANFSLLTGPEAAIKDLLTQFGVIAGFEGDMAKHTLTTLLIDENGKIIHRADGSVWESREFVAKMKRP